MLQGQNERFEYDQAEDAQKTVRRDTITKEFCLVVCVRTKKEEHILHIHTLKLCC